MSRFILPISVFFCLLSCSQNAVDQPSTYSKTEEAAYKAALEASGKLATAFAVKDIAVAAYGSLEEKARAAYVELEQAEKAYNKSEKAAEQAKASLSSLKRGIEKEIKNDPAYKSAQAALSEASRYGSKTSDKRYSLGLKVERIEREIYSKNRKALDQSENDVEAAYKSLKKNWDRLQLAKKQANKANRSLRNQAAEVEAAKKHVEETRQAVYMAAALGAFQHVADEAIAKMEYKPVARHDQ